MSALLEVIDLHAHYGRAHILDGISVAVAAGEVVALLGRNGAGKTTTLRCLMGLMRPSAGTVHFDGEDITGLPAHVIARRGLGWVPEDRRVFAGLSVLENLEVGRKPAGPAGDRDPHPAWPVERLLELFPALAPLRHRRAGSLSGGEQQMLTLARTLAGNPRVLLLDEPSEGLAPRIVEQIARIIGTLREDGVAILMSEQNRAFADAVADRALFLERGRIVRDGRPGDRLAAG